MNHARPKKKEAPGPTQAPLTVVSPRQRELFPVTTTDGHSITRPWMSMQDFPQVGGFYGRPTLSTAL